MHGRYEGENPYTKLAIQTLSFVRSDPDNQLIYLQRAATYAAIAQAIELENLGTILGAVGVAIAQTPDELERISSSIDGLPRLPR